MRVEWGDLPVLVHPQGGCLPAKRLARKCQQLESLATEVLSIVRGESSCWLISRDTEVDFLPDGPSDWRPHIVDFCSGGGHLGILLAHLLPSAVVSLVENKDESLRRAMQRVGKLGEIFFTPLSFNPLQLTNESLFLKE